MSRGAAGTGRAVAAASVTQIVRGQHGGGTWPVREQKVALFTRTALQNTSVIDMNLHRGLCF